MKVGPYYDDTAERELGWIIGQHHTKHRMIIVPSPGKLINEPFKDQVSRSA